jgi:urease accessory protein
MNPQSLLSLFQFSDGLFPAGGYAHSFGLETYVQEGVIRDLEGVEKFIRAYVKGSVGPCDAVAVVAALSLAHADNLSACLELDETLDAMKPVAEFREASRQMGRQTLRVAVALTNHPLPSALMNHVESYRTPGHHAVVFGLVGGVLGWPRREAATAFLYTTASLLVGASLRLLPIGQVAGQGLLHRLGPLIVELAADAEKKEVGDLSSFIPGIEIAGIRHATLESRLFRS